jgi:hypothetical protein
MWSKRHRQTSIAIHGPKTGLSPGVEDSLGRQVSGIRVEVRWNTTSHRSDVSTKASRLHLTHFLALTMGQLPHNVQENSLQDKALTAPNKKPRWAVASPRRGYVLFSHGMKVKHN